MALECQVMSSPQVVEPLLRVIAPPYNDAPKVPFHHFHYRFSFQEPAGLTAASQMRICQECADSLTLRASHSAGTHPATRETTALRIYELYMFPQLPLPNHQQLIIVT
jgi:hypothetical protein